MNSDYCTLDTHDYVACHELVTIPKSELSCISTIDSNLISEIGQILLSEKGFFM